MRITAIDIQTLNGAEGIVCRYGGGTRGAFVINTATRERAGLAPAVDSYTQGVRSQVLQLWRARGSEMDEYEFDELVNGIFYPPLGLRTLHGERDGVVYSTQIYVTSLQDVQGAEGVVWEISIDLISGLWHAAETTTTSESPIVVTGNVLALPKLTITGGQAVIRQRVTITDRTGHGVSAYLIAVTPAEAHTEANYRIHANGLEIPYAYENGKLYVRVDCGPPPERTFVDIHMGASINNTIYAGRLNRAGITLDAGIASGTITSDPTGSGDYPLAPALSWHPGISAPHNQSRDYVFGLSGNRIELVTEQGGVERNNLPDDVDSYIMVTGVEAERISGLNLSLWAGYQPGIRDGASSADEGGEGGPEQERVMRVIIQRFGGGGDHYAQWTLGLTTFPPTRSYIDTDESDLLFIVKETAWYDDYTVDQFLQAVQKYVGVTVTTGAANTLYLHFEPGAPEIPLISMQVNAKETLLEVYKKSSTADDDAGTLVASDYQPGEAPVVVFESVWVDPATMEPFEDNPETAGRTEAPVRGQARAVVRYRTRESEHWITAWSRTVTANSVGGTSASYSGLSVDVPGAVQIAIGLEPVATRPGFIDWGWLELTSAVTVELQAAKLPAAVLSAAIPALHIASGAVRNLRTNARISLVEYFADSNGLELDTEKLQIQGTDGVGVVLGSLTTNKSVRLFNLLPGDNAWEATGDLALEDVTVTYRERLAV